MKSAGSGSAVNKLILVAALGYFVDIYDLLLFSVERINSLKEVLGTSEITPELTATGQMLLNFQMGGMVVGGLFWGILGDKKGRLSVLFGSILVYSIANILNGMVNNVETYAGLRFLSGFGLAGELGAGITLVSESMSKEKRGIGTMIVATVGVFGAVVAGFVSPLIANWRWSFYIGGFMGLALLILRIGVFESGMFEEAKKSNVKRGNFFDLFKNKKRIAQYLSIIFIAVPVWYVMGTLITFAPDLFKIMQVKDFAPNVGKSVMFAYLGITFGDFISGALSQWLKSRKKVLGLFLIMTVIGVILYFTIAIRSEYLYYACILFLGLATGYWAVFMSTASELFGTNIRATATTTAPNFVRGSVILLSASVGFFKWILPSSDDGQSNAILAIILTGIICLGLGFLALWRINETFGKDLNYNEE